MTTTAYAVVIGLYVLCGAGELAAPLVSLLILAALWPVMLAARIVYRFVRKHMCAMLVNCERTEHD